MKIFRPAATVAALTASMVIGASAQAADTDAGFAPSNDTSIRDTSMVSTADDAISVARTYEQIRVDVATAEFTGDEMLSRIDGLVSRIDSLISVSDVANDELTQLRTATLQVRSEVVEFLAGNGNQLVQVTTPLPPVQGIMPNVGGEFISDPALGQPSASLGGGVPGTSVVASGGGGGAIAGGGGGAIAGGGALGAGGSMFGILGAAGAAAAVGFSDDNDDAGPIASQFAP